MVQADERESSEGALGAGHFLTFTHTFGHAIEKVAGYGVIL